MEHAEVPSMTREQMLETWVHIYARAILKNCFYLFADHDLAQDTMQDTFMKAWKYIGNTNHLAIQNEKAWLQICIECYLQSFFLIESNVHSSRSPP